MTYLFVGVSRSWRRVVILEEIILVRFFRNRVERTFSRLEAIVFGAACVRESLRVCTTACAHLRTYGPWFYRLLVGLRVLRNCWEILRLLSSDGNLLLCFKTDWHRLLYLLKLTESQPSQERSLGGEAFLVSLFLRVTSHTEVETLLLFTTSLCLRFVFKSFHQGQLGTCLLSKWFDRQDWLRYGWDQHNGPKFLDILLVVEVCLDLNVNNVPYFIVLFHLINRDWVMKETRDAYV